MNPQNHSPQELPPGLAGRIDSICDRFEAEWLAGTMPRMEDYLAEVDEPDRLAAVRELLALDVEYRFRKGDQPTPQDYYARLPGFAAAITAAFTVHSSAGSQTPHGESTVAQTVPPAPAFKNLPRIPGYEMLERLGQGGMGVVYKAQHLKLGRVVALKMILSGVHADAEDLARFRAEAEAVARLQHPNIVQIHEIGEHDGLPYFALEYCAGGSLHQKLQGTPQPPGEAAVLVEMLARAMHHAHGQHVIHRDLKPHNVLLAADGAPKVADFGLAKKLDVEGLSQSGDVMGTPSYMPPEQARGNTRELGPAVDVYALGAILYELLTGRPPFKGVTKVDTLRQVLSDEPVPPSRLQPKTPGDLETICLKCLQKDPKRRYGNALELGEDLRRYQSGEPILARPVGGFERVWKWARRRPTAAALMAALTILVFGGSAGAVWYANDRATRQTEEAVRQAELRLRGERLNQEVNSALDEAEGHFQWVRVRLDDPLKVAELLSDIDSWQAAVGRGGQALTRAISVSAGSETLLESETSQRLAALKVTQVMEQDGYRLGKELDEIRSEASVPIDEKFQPTKAGPKYEAFFARQGMDLAQGDLAVLAAAVKRSPIRFVLTAYLDHLAEFCLFKDHDQPELLKRLLEVARAADPDPWRSEFRKDTVWNDRAALPKLAENVALNEQPPQTILALGTALTRMGAQSAPLLGRALLFHPRDFWLQYSLYELAADSAEKVLRCHALLAIRPKSTVALLNLGIALRASKKLPEAIEAFTKAIEIDPKFALAYSNLSATLSDSKMLPEAIEASSKAIKLDPKHPGAYYNLGVALKDSKKLPEAIEAFNKAIEIDPKFAKAYNNLGFALADSKKLPEAIEAYNKAIEIDPKHAVAYYNLGIALHDNKKVPEAIEAFNRAIKLDPKFAMAYYNLGIALHGSNALPEAIEAFYMAIAIDSRFAIAYNNLGIALRASKKLPEAIEAYNMAIAIDPKFAKAYTNLGSALADSKKLPEAIDAFNKAIQLDPKLAVAYYNLGNGLYSSKTLPEAIEAFNKAIEIDPKYSAAYHNLGIALRDSKKLPEAIAAFDKAIEIDPKYSAAYHNLGIALRDSKKLPEAIAAYDKAIEIDPKYAVAYYNLGNAWNESKKLPEAIEAFNKAIEIDPKYAAAYYNLGNGLANTKKLAEAIEAFNKAIELNPKLAVAYNNLGITLRREGDFAKAVEALKTASALGYKGAAQVLPKYQRILDLSKNDVQQLLTLTTVRHGISGTLTKENPLDIGPQTIKSFRGSHPVQLQAGQPYQIDLTGDFDVFLRVEDANYLTLALNDDVTPPGHLNARLVFTPEKDGVYRLVVTTFKPSDTGKYTLTVKEIKPVGANVPIQGELKDSDPASSGKLRKVHKVDLVEGRPYVFKLDSPRFNSHLMLVDPTGKQALAQNNDAGDFVESSRIDFTPKESGTYQLIVTTAQPGETGPYTVRIQAYEPEDSSAKK